MAKAVFFLEGLLEVFYSELSNLATVSDNSVRYQAITALCGSPLVNFPEKDCFPHPKFSSDPIVSDKIFGDRPLSSFTFDIYLGTS